MKYALKVTICTTQKGMVANYGEAVWEELCNAFPGKFSIRQAANKLTCIDHLALRTRLSIVRVVLHNVLADYAERSDDYENICPVHRFGKQFYDVLG